MATLGTFAGDLVGIYVGANRIACTTTDTFSGTANQIDASCKGSGAFGAFLAGTLNWTMQSDGNVQFDATYGFSDLFAAWRNRSILTLKLSTEVAGDPFLTGDAQITAISFTGAINSPTTFSVTFSGTGDITESTVGAT